jgi:hypothetical protein
VTACKSNDDGQEVGLKKSKSLEDLQPELSPAPGLQKDQSNVSVPTRPSTACTSRICGGNESFRAAVDRSYENPDSAPMEAGKLLFIITLKRKWVT